MALAYTVRDRMMDRYISTIEAIVGTHSTAKVVGYLSAEFLTGPHLGNSLLNLGIQTSIEEALSAVGQDLETLLEQEEEPGLGTLRGVQRRRLLRRGGREDCIRNNFQGALSE
jgi:starch phosphorylase